MLVKVCRHHGWLELQMNASRLKISLASSVFFFIHLIIFLKVRWIFRWFKIFFSLYFQMTQMCYVGIMFFVFLILRAQLQKELYNKHHNTADGRIRVWFGIRQIMNSTDRLLLETRDAARQLKTGIHMVWNCGMFVCIHYVCVLVHSYISVTSSRMSTLWYI